MRYDVLDLTGRHTPSKQILKAWYDDLQGNFYAKIRYRRYVLTDSEKQLLLGVVIDASDINFVMSMVIRKG